MKLDWMIWSLHLEVGRLGVRLAAKILHVSCVKPPGVFLLISALFTMVFKLTETDELDVSESRGFHVQSHLFPDPIRTYKL